MIFLHVHVVRDQVTDKFWEQRRKPRHILRMISCHCWPGRTSMGQGNQPGRDCMGLKELSLHVPKLKYSTNARK